MNRLRGLKRKEVQTCTKLLFPELSNERLALGQPDLWGELPKPTTPGICVYVGWEGVREGLKVFLRFWRNRGNEAHGYKMKAAHFCGPP